MSCWALCLPVLLLQWSTITRTMTEAWMPNLLVMKKQNRGHHHYYSSPLPQRQRRKTVHLWYIPLPSRADVQWNSMNATDAVEAVVVDPISRNRWLNNNDDLFHLTTETLPPKPAAAVSSSAITTTTPMTTMTSLGDIMKTGQDEHDEPSTLASTYGITHPLDRLLLTANGNLQRLVASYYDAPVTVVVESCTLRQPPQQQEQQPPEAEEPQIWDRRVHLQIFGTTFMTAQSVIVVHDPTCQQLVQSGQVGLGQLFRHLNLLPEFELHAAGTHNNDNNKLGRLHWREYTLRCRRTLLTCRIVETFAPHVWELDGCSTSSECE